MDGDTIIRYKNDSHDWIFRDNDLCISRELSKTIKDTNQSDYESNVELFGEITIQFNNEVHLLYDGPMQIKSTNIEQQHAVNYDKTNDVRKSKTSNKEIIKQNNNKSVMCKHPIKISPDIKIKSIKTSKNNNSTSFTFKPKPIILNSESCSRTSYFCLPRKRIVDESTNKINTTIVPLPTTYDFVDLTASVDKITSKDESDNKRVDIDKPINDLDYKHNKILSKNGVTVLKENNDLQINTKVVRTSNSRKSSQIDNDNKHESQTILDNRIKNSKTIKDQLFYNSHVLSGEVSIISQNNILQNEQSAFEKDNKLQISNSVEVIALSKNKNSNYKNTLLTFQNKTQNDSTNESTNKKNDLKSIIISASREENLFKTCSRNKVDLGLNTKANTPICNEFYENIASIDVPIENVEESRQNQVVISKIKHSKESDIRHLLQDLKMLGNISCSTSQNFPDVSNNSGKSRNFIKKEQNSSVTKSLDNNVHNLDKDKTFDKSGVISDKQAAINSIKNKKNIQKDSKRKCCEVAKTLDNSPAKSSSIVNLDKSSSFTKKPKGKICEVETSSINNFSTSEKLPTKSSSIKKTIECKNFTQDDSKGKCLDNDTSSDNNQSTFNNLHAESRIINSVKTKKLTHKDLKRKLCEVSASIDNDCSISQNSSAELSNVINLGEKNETKEKSCKIATSIDNICSKSQNQSVESVSGINSVNSENCTLEEPKGQICKVITSIENFIEKCPAGSSSVSDLDKTRKNAQKDQTKIENDKRNKLTAIAFNIPDDVSSKSTKKQNCAQKKRKRTSCVITKSVDKNFSISDNVNKHDSTKPKIEEKTFEISNFVSMEIIDKAIENVNHSNITSMSPEVENTKLIQSILHSQKKMLRNGKFVIANKTDKKRRKRTVKFNDSQRRIVKEKSIKEEKSFTELDISQNNFSDICNSKNDSERPSLDDKPSSNGEVTHKVTVLNSENANVNKLPTISNLEEEVKPATQNLFETNSIISSEMVNNEINTSSNYLKSTLETIQESLSEDTNKKPSNSQTSNTLVIRENIVKDNENNEEVKDLQSDTHTDIKESQKQGSVINVSNESQTEKNNESLKAGLSVQKKVTEYFSIKANESNDTIVNSKEAEESINELHTVNLPNVDCTDDNNASPESALKSTKNVATLSNKSAKSRKINNKTVTENIIDNSNNCSLLEQKENIFMTENTETSINTTDNASSTKNVQANKILRSKKLKNRPMTRSKPANVLNLRKRLNKNNLIKKKKVSKESKKLLLTSLVDDTSEKLNNNKNDDTEADSEFKQPIAKTIKREQKIDETENIIKLDTIGTEIHTFHCKKCEKIFLRKSLLKKHEEESHPVENNNKKLVKKKLKLHTCIECDTNFNKLSALKNHECAGKKSVDKESLNKQNENEQISTNTVADAQNSSNKETGINNKEMTLDDLSNNCLPSNQDLKTSNNDVQTPIKRICLNVPGEDVKLVIEEYTAVEKPKTSLKAKNKSNKNFICPHCNVNMWTSNDLKVHVLRVHEKVKSKICPYCSRGFTCTGDLTRHIRLHTGEKPFKCTEEGCNMAFIASGDLNKHQRTHLGDKYPRKFSCSICGKTFKQRYEHDRHMRTAHTAQGSKQYECHLCNRQFGRKDGLIYHLRIHAGIKPYTCKKCGKEFTNPGNYKKHMNTKRHDLSPGSVPKKRRKKQETINLPSEETHEQ